MRRRDTVKKKKKSKKGLTVFLILFIFIVLSTTPPATGTQPPTRPVPAPRTVTGTFASWQSFRIAETSSVLSARHTASGRKRP